MGDHLPLALRLWFALLRARGAIGFIGILAMMIAYDDLEDMAFYVVFGAGMAMLALAWFLSTRAK